MPVVEAGRAGAPVIKTEATQAPEGAAPRSKKSNSFGNLLAPFKKRSAGPVDQGLGAAGPYPDR